MQDSQLGSNGVHYTEVPLYAGQPTGSQWCPLYRGSTLYRTASWVPIVSSIQRFHCTLYIERFQSIQDSQLGPDGVLYTEVPLYTGQPTGSQWCPLYRGSNLYRTANWVPMVSSIQRFHSIQDSQLGPNGVHYTEVPVYTGQPTGSRWCPLYRGSTLYRTANWVPMVSSIQRFHSIQDSQLGPNGVLNREVPLYTGQSAGSRWCPLYRGSTLYRTANWVPMVSSIQRFHSIQDSQLGPDGVHYTEVPLYTGQPTGS